MQPERLIRHRIINAKIIAVFYLMPPDFPIYATPLSRELIRFFFPNSLSNVHCDWENICD
jgi:hypothetical protein